MSLQQEICILLRDVLVLGEQADSFDENTPLLGAIPEFDSMAVVSIITALEEEYGLVVDDDEISAEVFESVGTLTRFVEEKLD
jgi:acyl carrier protein